MVAPRADGSGDAVGTALVGHDVRRVRPARGGVNEADPQKDVLDYATPKARGGGSSSAGENGDYERGAALYGS